MKIFSSILITILIWVGILWFGEYKNPGPSNYFPQIVFCVWFLMNAYIGVNPHEKKEVHTRWGKLFVSLKAGFYFFPFLWFWAIIYRIKKENDNINLNINYDQSKPVLNREISTIESIGREFLIPFLFRKGAWAIFICFLFGSLLGFYSVKYKNKIFYGIQNDFDPIMYVFTRHNNDSRSDKTNTIVTQPLQNQPQYNQSTAPSGQKTKDYNGMDTATRPVDSSVKADNSTTVVNQNSYQSTEAPPAPIVDWLPPEDAYNPTITWDNLKTRDVWTALAKMTTEMDYVNERGYFVSSSNSYNYFPSVFVDGFRGDQNFFCHFFKVYIRKLTFKNGETWQDGNMDFCDYVNIVSSTSRVDNTCYRDVKIYLKDQFKGKYSWHIIDAGYGDGDLSFEIFLYDRDHDYQSVISQNETIRTGHQYREHRPMTNEMNSKYLSDSKSNPEQKSEEERRLNAKTNKKRKRGDPPGSNY
jgi:hypothetical protein